MVISGSADELNAKETTTELASGSVEKASEQVSEKGDSSSKNQGKFTLSLRTDRSD